MAQSGVVCPNCVARFVTFGVDVGLPGCLLCAPERLDGGRPPRALRPQPPLAVLLVELDLVALLENAALVTTAKVGRGTVGTSTFTRSE